MSAGSESLQVNDMASTQPKATRPWNRLLAIFHLWSGRVHRHYGIVYGDTREFSNAVESYGRATKLNPRLAVAYLERGTLLWRELGRAVHAIRDLTIALTLRPDWPDALFNRGQAYQAAGNYRAAATDLSAFLSAGKGSMVEHARVQLVHLQAILDTQPPEQGDPHAA